MQRLPACGSDELHELCLTFIHKTPERSPRISESLPGMALMPMLPPRLAFCVLTKAVQRDFKRLSFMRFKK